MEITLTNFRCWEKKTISLSPCGITLLSGPSGAGKSSILEAILFAIIGKGRNIVMQGKTKCSVKLVLNDGTTILRRKRPNILTLKIPGGKTYEDDAAEGIINTMFTSNFETLGYLGQNKNSSFVLKGPADKLAFIEQLAFQRINIVELKNKAFELYKDEDRIFTTASTKKEILGQQVEELGDITTSAFPIKTSGGASARDAAETTVVSNLEKVASGIVKQQKLIEQLVRTERTGEMIQTKIEFNSKLEQSLRQEITEVEDSLLLLEPDIEQQLEKTKSNLSKLRRSRKATELKNKIAENQKNIDKLEEAEMEEMQTSVDTLKCWDNGTRRETVIEIKKNEAAITMLTEKSRLQAAIAKVSFNPETLLKKKESKTTVDTALDIAKENLRKARVAKEILTCPACQASLKMVNDVLSKSDTCTSTGESIPVIAAEVNTLAAKSKAATLSLLRWRSKKQTHENLAKELKVVSATTYDPTCDLLTPNTALVEKRRRNTELKTYLREGTHNETVKQQLLEKIEHNIFSNSIITMKSKLGKDRKRYEEKYKNRRETVVDGNEEDLLVEQERLQQEIYIKDSAEKKLKKLSISLGECVKKLSDLRGKLPKKSMTTLQRNIVEKKKQVELLLKKQVKYTRILHKIETFKIYASERERQKKLKEELKTTKAAAKEMKDRTTGAAILRTKIKEAEGLCLLSFVQSIQGEVQMYLDEFFSKDPLSLRLSTQKISKKGTSKPEINITMDYKGRECDPSSLSGGELQRVILAFTLAFTERFNLPFLLLDECTSNLDQELTSEVVHVVKKYQHSRPILLVAHQVVLGIFDKVVNI